MDFGEIGTNGIVILAIVALLVLNIFLRKRRGEKTPLEIAMGLLMDVSRNQKLAEDFQFNLKVNKFKTGSWKRNSNKIDFLDQSLQNTLASAFSMAEQFNQDIDAAKKHKSTTYLSGIAADKLKEPLAKSRQGLEEWLQANVGTQPMSGRKGCLFS